MFRHRTSTNIIVIPVIILLLFTCVQTVESAEDIPACDSEIYCHGQILKTIQEAGLFNDSKTFVDMNLKTDPANVINNFHKLFDTRNGSISKTEIREFVNDHFDGPGKEFERWIPKDLPETPTFLGKVKDPELRKFGLHLCQTWKHLGRKIKEEVKLYPGRYSLIYLPNPFIVPGGRFRETYYWDSYWVIKGLLVCEMKDTARGMLENFVYLIEKYGFIPNGGRIYYTRRSQPPFFIPMMYEYYKATKNKSFIEEHIGTMEKEYNFWVVNRTVDFEHNHRMSRYASSINRPRPESYIEDVSTAEKIPSDQRQELLSNIASAAESGMDFSSRWFSRNTSDLTLETTETRDIIPVDLNSMLCMNEQLMAEFYTLLGNRNKMEYFKQMHAGRISSINNLMWDESKGSWFDVSIRTNKKRTFFYQSNLYPLFTKCVHDFESKINRSIHYIKNMDVILRGGVPTSLDSTGQQWDYPNSWPPLQHIWIEALTRTNITEAEEMGRKLAETWLQSNWIGWNRTGNMFEKYSAIHPGSRGGGGEYDVQEGFGWTNGVALIILNRFGDSLHIEAKDQPVVNISCACYHRSYIVITLVIILCLSVLYVGYS